MAASLYPFRFTPVFRRYLWGGRRLGTVLGKPIGAESDYAESWEVVDHGRDQSVVSNGEFSGKSLGELVREFPAELLGRHRRYTSFPLLFKILDANDDLSVQVHPNDAQAAIRQPPDLGKTEAWVVLDATPGAKVYSGLNAGVDHATFARSLRDGTPQTCLHQFSPKPGDCIFIPAGTVHALGKGLLIAEIQQASDVTFRLFDWNRVGADGKPRQLHLEEGLAVTDFVRGPVLPQISSPTVDSTVERLVECDKFVLDRRTGPGSWIKNSDDRCHILSVVEGEVLVGKAPNELILTRGQTCLIPAVCAGITITPTCPSVLLDAYLP